jgi:cytochrome c oxidase cbb3-type subunit 3
MSDFTSYFWNWYIIVLVLGSIAYCAWLLWRTSKVKVQAAGTTVETTGHTWDGDLAEFNNPLPRWWMWLFWITIVFGLVYLAIFPGLGMLPGTLGWTSTGQYAKEAAEVDAKTKPLYDKYLAMDLKAVAADPQAQAMGQRLFLNYCSQCHGSDARGSRGFPNLADNDWLYGGDPEIVRESIANGRMGVMPPLGAALGDDNVKNVVAYVRSLSGLPHDSLKAQLGQAQYMQICAACHGPEGKGMQALGAPNLTDQIWLYDSSEKTITEGVMKGRHVGLEQKPMPAHKDSLGDGKIQVLAAYVWGLSNKPGAAAAAPAAATPAAAPAAPAAAPK